MKFILLFALHILFLPIVLNAQQKNIHKEIAAVLTEIKDFNNKEWKKDSSSNRILRSHTEDDFLRQYMFYKKVHDQLKAITKTTLTFDDQVNLELLQHQVLDELAEYQYKSYLNPILSDEGFHTGLARRANTTFNSKKDAEQYIKLLQDIPRFVDEYLQLMRTGVA